MVFFTCNACGQSVKKNQVEKHYQQQCRNCEVLSCMDCGKDFHGDEYMSHTKCISENQKYGGKEYKPKPNANKGEAKQEEWILCIQNTIDTTKVRPDLARLLKQLMTFENIPRQGVKFENFLKNCLQVYDKNLIKEAWEIFRKAKQNNKVSPVNENGLAKSSSETKSEETVTKKHKHKVNGSVDEISNKDCSSNSVNHSLKATSEEPMLKKHKKSKRHKDADGHGDEKNKKLNNDCSSVSINSPSDTLVEQTITKKHKKSKKHKNFNNDDDQDCKKSNADISVQSEMQNSSVVSNNDGNNGKKKFKWKRVIKTVLKNASDNEISMKKLQKKVLAEYYAMGGERQSMSENETRALFRKKVTGNSKFRVHEDRVKLVS